MSEPTNEDRAKWAKQGLDRFAKVVGIENEDLETQLSDFLADLMHLADQNNLDFDKIIDHGQTHFDEEVEEEEGEGEEGEEEEVEENEEEETADQP